MVWERHTRPPGMGTGQDLEEEKEGLFMLHPPEQLEFLPCVQKTTRQKAVRTLPVPAPKGAGLTKGAAPANAR